MGTSNIPGNLGCILDPVSQLWPWKPVMRKFNEIKRFVQKNGEEGTVRDECLSPDVSATEVAVEGGCVGVRGEGGGLVRRSRRLIEAHNGGGSAGGSDSGSACSSVQSQVGSVSWWDAEAVCDDKRRVIERARELMIQPRVTSEEDVSEVVEMVIKDESEDESDDDQNVSVGVQCGMQVCDKGTQWEWQANSESVDVGVQCSGSEFEVSEVAVATRRAAARWGQKERKMLWEVYEESIACGFKGFAGRMHAECMRRGMRQVSEAALLAQLREIKAGKLGDLEREQISRRVRERMQSGAAQSNAAQSEAAQSQAAQGEAAQSGAGQSDVTPNEEVNENAAEANVDAEAESSMHAGEAESVDDEGMEGSEGQADTWRQGREETAELDADMRAVLERLREVFAMETVGDSPSLKTRNRESVNKEVRLVNGVIHNIEVRSICDVNKLLQAGSYVVAERLGLLREGRGARQQRKDPWWKRRIEGKIKLWRADLSRVEEALQGRLCDTRVRERLDRVYNFTARGALGVKVFLRSKIQAGSTKIKRYLERNIQFHQNNLFRNNQSNLYKELNGTEKGDNPAPDAAEATQFWSNIWSVPNEHKRDAEWLRKVKRRLSGTQQQEDVSVSAADVLAGVRRMPCWKAPGPEGVRGFWFKKFTNLHQSIARRLQECLDSGNVPEWMVKGRTVLIQKDPAKGNVASNYRPLACLPLMWKLLTGIFADKVYDHLMDNNLLPAEQKGCRRRSRGTKDQLLIDKAVMLQAKGKKRNLAMAWVDYKKAYDMVPHSWLLEVVSMMGVARNISGLVERSMGNWKTQLSANGDILGEVKINRGIFQGDSFSPLLFVMIMIPMSMLLRDNDKGFKLGNNEEKINHLLFMDDLKLYASSEADLDVLVNEVYAYSNDIGMEFGMDKCASLVTKGGHRVKTVGVELPSGEEMKDVDEAGYKYLGVLQNESMMNGAMKKKVREEYLRRVKLLAKSKLYARNVIEGINVWAIGVVRYSAGILDWTKGELKAMDVRTRKLLTMNGVFNRKSGVGRLYVKRKDGGRGLVSAMDCVEGEKRSLSEYLRTSDEWMLKVVAEQRLIAEVESKKEYDQRVDTERKEGMESKVLHGRFFRSVKDKASMRSNDWLKSGYLGKATEAFICAAQEEVLETRSRKARIYGEEVDPKCRLCGQWEETVMHLASGCDNLARKQYMIRHDNVGRRVHWELCKKYDVECCERWYEHEPESVVASRNGRVEIYWDKTIWVSKALEHNKPDVVVVDRDAKKWTFVDFSVPMDFNVVKKEDEKVSNYSPLAQEIRKIYKVQTEIIPIILGALGTVPLRLEGYLKRLGIPDIIGCMQKTALLGTQRILKNALYV